jgi:hypothetical protein
VTEQKNLTCDICGYTHPKPDRWAIVIECPDGVLRCKVCRGAAKFNSKKIKEVGHES